jgi:hypothetical protein
MKLLLSLVLLTSCAHPKQFKTTVALERPGWSAIVMEPRTDCKYPKCEAFLILATHPSVLVQVREELCTKSHVCFGPDPKGQVFIVERRRK